MMYLNLPGVALVILCLVEGANGIRAIQVPQDVTGVEGGNTITFSCRVTGRTSNIELLWQIKFTNMNDVIYKTADSTQTYGTYPFGLSGSRGTYQTESTVQYGSTVADNIYELTLRINGVTRNDAGQFGCAYKYVQTDSTATVFDRLVMLVVLYPPDSPPTCSYIVTPIPNPRTPGSVSVQLLCNSAGGNPAASLAWYYEDSGGGISDGGETWLTMTPNDEGRELSCRATGPAITGYLSCRVAPTWTDVLTTPEPQPVLSPPTDPICSFNVAQTSDPLYVQVTLTCMSFGGNPSPDISWRTDQGSIVPGGAQVQLQMHLSASPRPYTCIVRSEALTEPLQCVIVPVLPPIAPDPQYPECSYEILTNPIVSAQDPVLIKLNCISMGGQPPAVLTWHDNQGQVSSLYIFIIPDPSLTYTCRATSSAITTERKCTVTPELPPIPTTVPPTTVPRLIPPLDGYPTCTYVIASEVTAAGAQVQLSCISSGGTPPAQLTWYDNSNNVMATDAVYITSVTHESSRVFTCQATSPAINTERRCDVTIVLPPIPPDDGYPMCSYNIITQVTTAGAVVELTCASSGGAPAAQLTWYEFNNVVATSAVYSTFAPHEPNRVFTCQATSAAISTERKCDVTIELPPIPPDDGYPMCSYKIASDVSTVGALVQLTCITSGGIPPAQLTWYDSSDVLFSGAVHNVFVRHESMQVFTCRASSPAITTERKCDVTPELPSIPTTLTPTTVAVLIPPLAEYPMCSYTIISEVTVMGAQIQLNCISYGGTPPAQLAWYDNSNSILFYGPVFTIFVAHATPRVLTCRAISPAITTERTCTVIPELPPIPTTQTPLTTRRTEPPPIPTITPSTTPRAKAPDNGFPTCSYEILSQAVSADTFVDVLITCYSHGGYPAAQLAWYDHESIFLSFNANMTVNINPQPWRFFKCRAFNAAITSERSCVVTPKLPLIVTTQPTTPTPTTDTTTKNAPSTIKYTTKSLLMSPEGSKTSPTLKPTMTQTSSTVDLVSLSPPPQSLASNVMAIVSIASGVVIVVIIVVLIVTCLVRAVVKGNFTYGRHYSRRTPSQRRPSSAAYPPLNSHVPHMVSNPIFDAQIINDSSFNMHQQPLPAVPDQPYVINGPSFEQNPHLYASMDDIRPTDNNHAYEYPTDDNPYDTNISRRDSET